MTTTMRWFIIIVLGGAFLAVAARACAVPAGGVPVAKVYLPLTAQGAPRCNRWRGDDWWPCIEATLTADARISSTPTATFLPWSSRTPTPGLPATGGARESIKLDGRAGYCAPMGDGCYTAGHVLRGAPWAVNVGGQPAAWSIDAAGRDLGHMVGWSDASVLLREAVIGEVLLWSNARAPGRWHVVAAGGGAITVCGLEGYVITGDSGTGGYAESDGALVGVLTNADLGQGWQASLACESGQEARLAAVP